MIIILIPQIIVISLHKVYVKFWIILTNINITTWLSYWAYHHNPIIATLPLVQYETNILPLLGRIT